MGSVGGWGRLCPPKALLPGRDWGPLLVSAPVSQVALEAAGISLTGPQADAPICYGESWKLLWFITVGRATV